ncbi:MAG TPA: ABC transporter, partial [Flavobacterium sp.]|nr:ABC transporter [Flavobacterium sp.]
MKELQYLNKYFIKYKFQFLLGILITIASQIFALFTPEYIGRIVTLVENLQNGNVAEDTVESQ